MSPDAARRTAQHCRRLLTAHIITPHDFAVADAALWRLRRHGRADWCADYASIARLAGVARSTAFNSMQKLMQLGIVTKTRRRLRVAWGRAGACVASRAMPNGWKFCTESAARTPDKGEARIISCKHGAPMKKNALERALSLLAGAIAGADGWTDPRAVQSGKS
jgi:hypothetical protein